MSNRPTPETDVFSVSFKSIDDQAGKKKWVPADFASRLERERNQAREFALQLERERDEAREELHDIRLNLGEDADGYTLLHAVCVLQNKRDEAREALMKIEDLFIDGTDIYADREKMGMIAREALDERTQARIETK